MEFVPQPEEAKKFGTIKWFKWHMYKYPQIVAMIIPVPFIIFGLVRSQLAVSRGINDGTYVPGVIQNQYTICRSSDYLAQNTPKRYTN